MTDKPSKGFAKRVLCALAMLACWAFVSHGEEPQDEKDRTLVTIRLVSNDPARALPQTIAKEDVARVLGLRAYMQFYENKHYRGGASERFEIIEYSDGVIKTWMDSPRKAFESVRARSKVEAEGFDECWIRFTLGTSRDFPWEVPLNAKPEPVTVTDPDLRELEVVMPVRYVRRVAEGDPSLKARLRLVSGATGEGIARCRLDVTGSLSWVSRDETTDDQGFVDVMVYGDEDVVVRHSMLDSIGRADRIEEMTVPADRIRQNLRDGKPIVLTSATPRVTGRLRVDDPEWQKKLSELKGSVLVAFRTGPNQIAEYNMQIENGRFGIYEPDMEAGIETRLLKFTRDFSAFELAEEIRFPLPEAGANREMTVPILAPRTVKARVVVRSRGSGAPVAGATVVLESKGKEPLQGTTGKDGTATIEIPLGEHKATVSAPGHETVSRTERILSGREVAVALRRLVEMDVTVTGRDGRDLEGVLAVDAAGPIGGTPFAGGATQATMSVLEGPGFAVVMGKNMKPVWIGPMQAKAGERLAIDIAPPVQVKASLPIGEAVAERWALIEKTGSRIGIVLLDRQTGIPVTDDLPVGKPFEVSVPRGQYNVYLVLPTEELPPGHESESEEMLKMSVGESWVPLRPLDLRKDPVGKPYETELEIPKTYRPVTRYDVVHPAFR